MGVSGIFGRGRVAVGLVLVATAVVVAGAAGRGTPFSGAGELDTGTFNPPTGFVTTSVGPAASIGGLVAQPGGKVVAAGAAPLGVALVRYLDDGKLDRSFGIDGVAAVPIGLPVVADAMAQGPPRQSKIVTVGSTGQFFAVRHTSDGVLDRSFGADGRAFIDVGETPVANGGAVQGDGKILIVGSSGNPFADPSTEAAVLARLNRDGSIDTSFGGGDGYVTLQALEGSIGFGAAVQRDGRIVMVGEATEPAAQGGVELLIARFLKDGTLDPSFADGAGYRTVRVGVKATGQHVVVQPNGEIVVSGTGNANDVQGWLLARFSRDGSLDTKHFGAPNGWVVASPLLPTANVGTAYSVDLQRNGKIVAAGSFGQNAATSQFHVARFNRDGTVDRLFGTDGFTRTDVASYSVPSELLIQLNGKIVLGGQANVGGVYEFAVARYLAR